MAINGLQWEVIQPGVINDDKNKVSNFMKANSGPTSYAKNCIVDGNPISAFHMLIDESLIKHIKDCTETEAQSQLGTSNWAISVEELYAVIGIMYARGTVAKGQELDQLWSKQWGSAYFKNTMSRNRFREILKFIRFDMKSTRPVKLKTDKFAFISHVWNKFIKNCNNCYKPNDNISIGEQLFQTKTRCPFTLYIASKPNKFGIKFWLAIDTSTKFLINGFPYLGNDMYTPRDEQVGDDVIEKLVKPYINEGRNITVDNISSSLDLVKNLKSKKTTLVGTMKKFRREIPQEIKYCKYECFDSVILTNDACTLTVYQSKSSKNIIVMSSLHSTVNIENSPKKLPETIAYYNRTKCGVDILNTMARKYTTKFSSRRWPLQVFYNILDLAAINAWILYQEITGNKMNRKMFILELASQLQSLLTNDNFSNLETIPVPIECSKPLNTRRQCQIKMCKGNKTYAICRVCKKAVCGRCVGDIVKISTCAKCI